MMIPNSALFPLNSDTGRPAVKWSEPWTGTLNPGDWYGIATGKRSGVWVLDLDVKNGKNGLRSISECGELPDTRTVRTRSGGLHLYFAYDEADPIGNRVGILPGVDVRGDGGFVVGPGSGGVYNVVLDVPVADAPEWLLALVRRPKGAAAGIRAVAIDATHPDWEYRLEKAQHYLETAPVCIEKVNGQAQIWKVALTLSRSYELPIEKSLELLESYNAQCLPPWSKEDLRRTLTNAAERGETICGTFAKDFMAPAPVAPAVPGTITIDVSAGSAAWRNMPNPEHAYTFDLALEAGSGSSNAGAPFSQRELIAGMTGPGASEAWRGVWQYDEFRHKLIAVNPPLSLDAEDKGLTETDVIKVQAWYGCHGMKANTAMIRSAIMVAADAAKFHPVRDYLDALPKMSAADADAYFRGIAGRLWGAIPERDALESGHLRRFALAAVRRVTHAGFFSGPDGRSHMRGPGTKVDVMLILFGEQGRNKSRFCEHLFSKEYFLDQLPAIDGKEASIALEGMWGVEVAEMTSFARSGEAARKEFLSRCIDKYRPVYGLGPIACKRQVVFVGTTNDDDFLTDPTGARRYDVCEIQQDIDLSFSRDEFWAAASALESVGEMHWVPVRNTPESEKSAGTSSARHERQDAWTDEVIAFCRTRIADGWVTAKMALQRGVAIETSKQDDKQLTRVKSILRRHLGASKVQWIDGRAQRVYTVAPGFMG